MMSRTQVAAVRFMEELDQTLSKRGTIIESALKCNVTRPEAFSNLIMQKANAEKESVMMNFSQQMSSQSKAESKSIEAKGIRDLQEL